MNDDTALTDAEIASANLVLWGDPQSNAVLKRIADQLPIRWQADAIQAGDSVLSRRRSRPHPDLPEPA